MFQRNQFDSQYRNDLGYNERRARTLVQDRRVYRAGLLGLFANHGRYKCSEALKAMRGQQGHLSHNDVIDIFCDLEGDRLIHEINRSGQFRFEKIA